MVDLEGLEPSVSCLPTPVWEGNLVDFAARLAAEKLWQETLEALNLYRFVLMVYHSRLCNRDFLSSGSVLTHA